MAAGSRSQETRPARYTAWPSRAVTPACDPGMGPAFRRWATSQRPVFGSRGEIAVLVPGGSSGGARQAAVWCWLLTAACMILVFLDPPSIGRGGWLAAAAALAMTAGAIQHRASRHDRRLCQSKVIFPESLDETCRALLGRAQAAIGTILASDVRAAGLLGNPVHDRLLREHEWEIAGQLREITDFRSLHAASTPGRPAGPMTADVLSAQQRAIGLAQEAIAARVAGLEHYARQIAAADDAERDWQQAVRLSEFNDKYLDLVARTASDETAAGEIAGLSGQLAAAAKARHDRLHEADLAAHVLALPGTSAEIPRQALPAE
jgi:hypothetical protein